MSYTTYAPLLEIRVPPVRRAASLAGQGMLWLGSGLGFAMTIYLCVAWPGLMD